jgi:hypothetical protein
MATDPRPEPEGIQNKIDQGLASLARGEGVDGEEFFKALERDEESLAGSGGV